MQYCGSHYYYYSRYLDENIRTHIKSPRANLKDDETFIESNKLHGEIPDGVFLLLHLNIRLSILTFSLHAFLCVCVQLLMVMCTVTWMAWTWRWMIRFIGIWWEWAMTWTYTPCTGMDTVWNIRYSIKKYKHVETLIHKHTVYKQTYSSTHKW